MLKIQKTEGNGWSDVPEETEREDSPELRDADNKEKWEGK